MESSLPKPLPKPTSRSSSNAPSRLKPSSSSSSSLLLRLTSIPTLPKIREEPLQKEEGLLAASEYAECALSDLPDPVAVSGPSAASDLSPLSVGSSDVTEEQKVLSGADCLPGPDHVSPDLPRSSAKVALCLSHSVALAGTFLERIMIREITDGNYTLDRIVRRALLVPKVHGEHLNKGKSDEVIPPLDLINKALDDINQTKDVLDDTKKIMDAMFEVAVQQFNGMDSAKRAARAADPCVMIKLHFATMLLFILFLVVRRVFKHCIADDDEWPYGLTPT